MLTLISPYNDITGYAVRILSAYIRSKGFKSRLIFFPDLEFGSNRTPLDPENAYGATSINQLIDLCSDSSLIGISSYTSNFRNAVYLTERLKAKLGGVPIIWGGKHPSARPEQALSYADMVCLGEGEEALCELLRKMDGGQDYYRTPNIWFKRNGAIIKNPPGPLIENLDLIPFPDYSFDNHYVREMKEHKIVPLTPELFGEYILSEHPTGLKPYETLFSRGCPYSCSYCFSFKGMYRGQKYLRFRSVENLIQELEFIKQKLPSIQMVWFVDDNLFMMPMEKIREFCKVYKERIALPMTFAGHPRDINGENLACFIDAGLIRIHMGIQTGSERIKNLFNRKIPDETILKAVGCVHKFKDSLFPSYDVIIDNPYETNEDLRDTIKLLLRFPRPRHIKLFSLSFFPGTALYEKAKEDGKLAKEEDFGIYGRDLLSFHFRGKKYLNFVLLLLNRNIPNTLIKMLINRYIIFLLDRPLLNEFLFKVLAFLRGRRDKEKKI